MKLITFFAARQRYSTMHVTRASKWVPHPCSYWTMCSLQ